MPVGDTAAALDLDGHKRVRLLGRDRHQQRLGVDAIASAVTRSDGTSARPTRASPIGTRSVVAPLAETVMPSSEVAASPVSRPRSRR